MLLSRSVNKYFSDCRYKRLYSFGGEQWPSVKDSDSGSKVRELSL